MTKKFGIIGNPINHSLSPILHNYWFEKYKIDAEYSIIDIKENELAKIVNKLKDKELNGINITLPFKQKIVHLVDSLVNDAEITGSVNTLYLKNQNVIVGENTDVFGLQAAYLKEIEGASKKKALVIGAGGVSPSVIFSLGDPAKLFAPVSTFIPAQDPIPSINSGILFFFEDVCLIVSSYSMTPPIQFFISDEQKRVSLKSNLFSGVEGTPTPSSLLVIVPVLSSAARIPLPFSRILFTILFSSDILI